MKLFYSTAIIMACVALSSCEPKGNDTNEDVVEKILPMEEWHEITSIYDISMYASFEPQVIEKELRHTISVIMKPKGDTKVSDLLDGDKTETYKFDSDGCDGTLKYNHSVVTITHKSDYYFQIVSIEEQDKDGKRISYKTPIKTIQRDIIDSKWVFDCLTYHLKQTRCWLNGNITPLYLNEFELLRRRGLVKKADMMTINTTY